MAHASRWSNRVPTAEEHDAASRDPDALLMLDFQSGSLEAFEELFARHARAVVNYAFRFVRDRAVAEELAQEVFLRVHDAAGGYRPGARFTTWLYRIATNVCLNEVRRPRFKAHHKAIDAEHGGWEAAHALQIEDGRPAPDTLLHRDDLRQVIRQGLDSLPFKQRLAFVLNKYQGLSYAEVAEVMKTSEKAVKSLIHRAKESLAERLRPMMPGLL